MLAFVNNKARRSPRQVESVLWLFRLCRAVFQLWLWSQQQARTSVSSCHNFKFVYPFVLRLKGFLLLNDKRWLNDEVLNAFTQLINATCRRLDSFGSSPQVSSAIVLNSFFYSKLAE